MDLLIIFNFITVFILITISNIILNIFNIRKKLYKYYFVNVLVVFAIVLLVALVFPE